MALLSKYYQSRPITGMLAVADGIEITLFFSIDCIDWIWQGFRGPEQKHRHEYSVWLSQHCQKTQGEDESIVTKFNNNWYHWSSELHCIGQLFP